MPERGLKELSRSLKKSAKKDMTDLCIASSMCPLELMKSIRYDIFFIFIRYKREKKIYWYITTFVKVHVMLLYLDIYFLKSF